MINKIFKYQKPIYYNEISLAVAGYREFSDFELFYNCINSLTKKINHINVGDCRGTDELAIKYAKMMGISYKIHRAKWKTYGKSAGPMRNKELIKKSDCLVAFDHDNSIGTKDAIRKAKQLGKRVIVFNIKFDKDKKKWQIKLGNKTLELIKNKNIL